MRLRLDSEIGDGEYDGIELFCVCPLFMLWVEGPVVESFIEDYEGKVELWQQSLESVLDLICRMSVF